MKKPLCASVLIATSALGAGVSYPTLSQESISQSGGRLELEEIIVTARRMEERSQDVPISMAVFSQQQLNRANIVNAGDLATYTPSLQMNQRFGGDTTSFAIRGFSQELRTTASVGVYFAEVVAPRGANSSVSGDGAGPGDFFDLANVQVLKGPQGTLFGRNTTGGAILLTPQKPTDQFEGYLEVSAGNYDMWRGQGVVNVPVNDRVRLRLGVDSQQRDGYLNNISDIGPDDFANIDYTAWRASAVVDITDTIENYTILKYVHSDNNGSPGSLFACSPTLGAVLCQPDLDRRKAAGHDDFYDVYNYVPDPVSEIKQGQVINTTTWDVNKNFTVKNILAYAQLETNSRNAIYGTYCIYPTIHQRFIFQMLGLSDGRPTTDQETLVEEFRIEGRSFDDRLVWQAGLYYEKSEPHGDYGSQSPSFITCDQGSIRSPNPSDWRCNQPSSRGAVASSPGGVTYKNRGVYAQSTYDISDEWSATVGLRYTDDETDGELTESIYTFPAPVGTTGQLFPPNRVVVNHNTPSTQSDEPTWLLGLDYKPSDDMMIYAKYARGYRQGNVNLAGLDEEKGGVKFNVSDPEQVDNYEIGAKTSFSGLFPTVFNIAAFYNDFQDQQIQYGYFKKSGIGTTSIINSGASTIWGIEIEGSVQVVENFILSGSYTYLNTETDKLEVPPYPDGASPGGALSLTTAEGEPLSYSPENKLALTASYLLPFDASLGDMTVSATYVYTDEMQAVSQATSPYYLLDDYDLVNLNFDWKGIAGSPVDLSIFATNVTDEEYITFLTGNWYNIGAESGQVGIPRMYGARLRYNFKG